MAGPNVGDINWKIGVATNLEAIKQLNAALKDSFKLQQQYQRSTQQAQQQAQRQAREENTLTRARNQAVIEQERQAARLVRAQAVTVYPSVSNEGAAW